MALTDFQRSICRLVADHRKRTGVSYVAGAAALNLLLDGARLSRDIDIFHDAEEAVHSSFATDRRLLESAGYTVTTLRELPGFVAAVVGRFEDTVRMEWARDSAFRFFPLMEHEQRGLTLHPFDLATNKVLALVGRLEVRDWVDVINADRRLQPLGYLLWAACGKDPGCQSRFAARPRAPHHPLFGSRSRTARLPGRGARCRGAGTHLAWVVGTRFLGHRPAAGRRGGPVRAGRPRQPVHVQSRSPAGGCRQAESPLPSRIARRRLSAARNLTEPWPGPIGATHNPPRRGHRAGGTAQNLRDERDDGP